MNIFKYLTIVSSWIARLPFTTIQLLFNTTKNIHILVPHSWYGFHRPIKNISRLGGLKGTIGYYIRFCVQKIVDIFIKQLPEKKKFIKKHRIVDKYKFIPITNPV